MEQIFSFNPVGESIRWFYFEYLIKFGFWDTEIYRYLALLLNREKL